MHNHQSQVNLAISCSKFGISGGMERYAYDLIYGLNEQQWNPTVITRKVDNNLSNLEQFNIKIINVKWIPGKLRDRYFSWCIDQYKRKNNITTLIACSRISSPDIAICGGTHIGFIQATGKYKKWSDELHIKLEMQQYHNARAIVAHSRLMKNELISFYNVDPDKVHLIYPPVNNSRFHPVADQCRMQLREKFNFVSNKYYFIFPSGSHERKGLPFLKQFFESTNLPVELVVVGKEPVKGKNIRHIPFTSEIEQLYQAADATILASLYEPFGLVGIESVLCGTPIVFADNIGCCEVIQPPAKQTFELGNIDSLFLAINSTLKFSRQQYTNLETFIDYDVSVRHHLEQLKPLIL